MYSNTSTTAATTICIPKTIITTLTNIWTVTIPIITTTLMAVTLTNITTLLLLLPLVTITVAKMLFLQDANVPQLLVHLPPPNIIVKLLMSHAHILMKRTLTT